MSVFQINIWTCEICGTTVTMGEGVFPHTDPVVGLEYENWKYVERDGTEKLVCEICQSKDINRERRLRLIGRAFLPTQPQQIHFGVLAAPGNEVFAPRRYGVRPIAERQIGALPDVFP